MGSLALIHGEAAAFFCCFPQAPSGLVVPVNVQDRPTARAHARLLLFARGCSRSRPFLPLFFPACTRPCLHPSPPRAPCRVPPDRVETVPGPVGPRVAGHSAHGRGYGSRAGARFRTPLPLAQAPLRLLEAPFEKAPLERQQSVSRCRQPGQSLLLAVPVRHPVFLSSVILSLILSLVRPCARLLTVVHVSAQALTGGEGRVAEAWRSRMGAPGFPPVAHRVRRGILRSECR